MKYSLIVKTLFYSLIRSHESVSFRREDAAEESLLSKDMRSSDSLRKAFARKMREMDVPINWLISMLVVEEGC